MEFNTGFLDFIAGLLPSTNRNEILVEIDRVMKDMDETVLPSCNVMRSTIQDTAIYKKLGGHLNSHAPDYRGDIPTYLTALVKKTLDGRRDLEKIIEKKFGKEIEKEGLDYKRGHILHLIAMLEFFNSYVIRFMLCATKQALADSYYPADKRDLEFVSFVGNLEKFSVICAALEKEFKNLDKILSKVDGITVDKETAKSTSAVIGAGIDPLKTGFYTVDYNPFYLGGKIKNQIHLFFFEYKQEQVKKLQFHVMKLNEQKANGIGNTEQLDKSIAYHSNRLNRLSAEIEEELNDASEI